jgi:hypothetical protein
MARSDSFATAYIETALWTEGLEDKGEISPACRKQMQSDCDAFQRNFGSVIETANFSGKGDKWSQAGHDFWLTRNGHGAGFWDGDWSEPQAKMLTDAAHRFGKFDLYEGDDGQIHCYPPPNSALNPISSMSSMSTGTKVAIAAGAVTVLGLAYWFFTQSSSSSSASSGSSGSSGSGGSSSSGSSSGEDGGQLIGSNMGDGSLGPATTGAGDGSSQASVGNVVTALTGGIAQQAPPGQENTNYLDPSNW